MLIRPWVKYNWESNRTSNFKSAELQLEELFKIINFFSVFNLLAWTNFLNLTSFEAPTPYKNRTKDFSESLL